MTTAESRFARVARLLSVLAHNEPGGLRLTEVVETVSLPKTSVHRMLDELSDAGLVSYEQSDQRYHVGDFIDFLSRAARERFDFRLRAQPLLQQMVDELGDTVYLMLVRDNRILCVERLLGDYPIQSLSLDVGDVRPMGVGSSGAIVASLLSPERFGSLMDSQVEERRALGIKDSQMLQIVAAARRDGYSFNRGTIVPGVSGVGVALVSPSGVPKGAVSLVALNSRFANGRKLQVAKRLQKFAQEASVLLA